MDPFALRPVAQGPEGLLPDIPAVGDLHPRALVKPRRPRGTLGVDTELTPRDPSAVELRERRDEQREGDAAPTPRPAHRQVSHLAGVLSARRRGRAADRTGDLAFLLR